MHCQICQKNEATVHITELEHFPSDGGESTEQPKFQERHICERCAAHHNVPFSGVLGNKSEAVWKLLMESARRARAESGLSCPECGMTLAEFRNKGRFGCPADYKVFEKHVRPLLLRVHNATQHTGFGPRIDEHQKERLVRLSGLQEKLQEAIREEAYESAAQLRDEISAMEAPREREA